MEENKHGTNGVTSRSKCACGLVPFLAGVVVALAFGWWVFPDLMFTSKAQPFYFSHKAHVETAGLSCESCHTAGLPTLENCSSCHAAPDSMQTAIPGPTATAAEKAAYAAEKTFIQEYVVPGKEVPWKKHQKQPDNVYFSHLAHLAKCYTCHGSMKDRVDENGNVTARLNLGTLANPQKLCMTCHPSLDELDKNIAVQENVLTGYSRKTMKMWQCERCHAHPGHFYDDGKGRTAANNACYTCHK